KNCWRWATSCPTATSPPEPSRERVVLPRITEGRNGIETRSGPSYLSLQRGARVNPGCEGRTLGAERDSTLENRLARRTLRDDRVDVINLGEEGCGASARRSAQHDG
ncbi:MAG: hypothetical protein AB7I30_16875, partial [Isosphaeraceae bacterium]